MLGAAPVTNGEVEDGDKDERREENVNRGEEVKEIVHSLRDGGRLIRYDLEPLPHSVQSPLRFWISDFARNANPARISSGNATDHRNLTTPKLNP